MAPLLLEMKKMACAAGLSIDKGQKGLERTKQHGLPKPLWILRTAALPHF